MPRLIGIQGLACAVPQNVRFSTGIVTAGDPRFAARAEQVGSVPHVSPPGSFFEAIVLNRQTCLPVVASYALMKHFSSR